MAQEISPTLLLNANLVADPYPFYRRLRAEPEEMDASADAPLQRHMIGVDWPHHVFVSKDFKVIGAQ